MKKTKLFVLISVLLIGACHSQSTKKTTNTDIVLVNVGRLDRAGIAKEISIISTLDPKVVAIDLQFRDSKKDNGDALLVNALEDCKDLIMPTIFESIGNNEVIISTGSAAEFLPLHAKTGFISALKEYDQKKIITQKENIFSRQTEYHFSVSTAMIFDSLKAISFVKNNPETVDIDYKNGNRLFKIFSSEEVLSRRITRLDIEGKIVMIGFLGPGNEDKIFTPLNTNPNEPDMYGVEYLANIVAQVLGQ